VENQLEKIIIKLLAWIEKQGYSGYDLFDGLCSPYEKYFTFNKKILRQCWQQFFKRTPINFRELFKIRKRVIPKTIADIIVALINLSTYYKDNRYDRKLESLSELMISLSYKGYPYLCWGVGLVYQSRNVYTTPKVPNIITTYYCGMALLDLYEYFRDPKYLERANTIIKFILEDIKYVPQKKGICFNYFSHQTDTIHNANVLAAAFLSRISMTIKDKNLLELAEQSFAFTASRQNKDGSWFYGEAKNQKWVDNFHTGYILDSFYLFEKYTGEKQFHEVLNKGKAYYLKHFFFQNKIPKYYNNKIYPIDIQCIAQAIQTLSIVYDDSEKPITLLNNIYRWTINNMFSHTGYFYYQKNLLYINKIPYMRWGESTMLVALTHLMKAIIPTYTNGGIK